MPIPIPAACLRCGSDALIPDARLIDRGDGNSRDHIEVGIVTRPEAFVFTGEIRSETRAFVCVDCGFVELRVVDTDALWKAHLDRIANGWTLAAPR